MTKWLLGGEEKRWKRRGDGSEKQSREEEWRWKARQGEETKEDMRREVKDIGQFCPEQLIQAKLSSPLADFLP